MTPDEESIAALLHLINVKELWSYGLELVYARDLGTIVLQETDGSKRVPDEDLVELAMAFLNSKAYARG